MNQHQVFKTPWIPVIMMVTGLNYLLENPSLSALLGIGIYAFVIGIEQKIDRSI